MAVLGGMGNCDLKREERYLVKAPSNMKLLGHGRCLGDCLLSK